MAAKDAEDEAERAREAEKAEKADKKGKGKDKDKGGKRAKSKSPAGEMIKHNLPFSFFFSFLISISFISATFHFQSNTYENIQISKYTLSVKRNLSLLQGDAH